MTYSYALSTQRSEPTPLPFLWRIGSYGSCNASCGGGTQTRVVICVQESTDSIIDDSFCTAASRPVNSRPCNSALCPSRWKVDSDWSKCSASCGGGLKIRKVVCARQDDSTIELNDRECLRKPKPKSSRSCNTSPCPSWKTGRWSQVGTTLYLDIPLL